MKKKNKTAKRKKCKVDKRKLRAITGEILNEKKGAIPVEHLVGIWILAFLLVMSILLKVWQ
jgi:hypothetical protein